MTSNDSTIVITGAARTAIGSFQGALASVAAPALGARAIEAAVDRSGIRNSDVGEVLMGCVLPAGLGQAPARQAALLAGIPDAVPTSTVNKVCGSGMKTVMLAHDAILEHAVGAHMQQTRTVPRPRRAERD